MEAMVNDHQEDINEFETVQQNLPKWLAKNLGE